ncbi:enoyl-CoA hydratase/isomerase family protein [Candidatus Poribacteria bacterium]|nr:enoyl-CoA hydratase/isomerase family protein [Candidatus Poribacteria bacterium]
MPTIKTSDTKPIKTSEEASLFDLGEGIAYFEMHGKLNIIEDNLLSMLNSALDEVETNYSGLVVGTEADHFSVGLNLKLLLERARSQNWKAISNTLRNLQKVCIRMRLSSIPVVAATTGMALGGGCELAFGADAVQAHTNSKLGLVELRVGLIPGGGGTTEMAFRCLDDKDTSTPIQQLMPSLLKTFNTIREAKVSENSVEAKKLGFLRESDLITTDRINLLHDAKQFAISLHNNNYQPHQPRNIFVLGEEGINYINLHIQKLREQNAINDYEQTLAEKLAYVICGGRLSKPQFVTEQYMLDLEHEIFLSLCSEPDTHAMIESTINKSKK